MGFFTDNGDPGFRSAGTTQAHSNYAAYAAQREADSMKAGIVIILVLVIVAAVAVTWLYRRRRAIGEATIDGAALALRLSRGTRGRWRDFAARVESRAASKAEN